MLKLDEVAKIELPPRIRIGAIIPVKLPFKLGVSPRYETEDFGKTTPLFVDFKE